MGNLLFGTKASGKQAEEQIDEVDHDFDSKSKNEIVDYIQKMKIKKLDYDDPNFAQILKDIDLENEELIPMMLELYGKLKLEVNEYKVIVVDKTKKFKKNIKPQFGSDKYLNDLTLKANEKIQVTNLSEYNIKASTTAYDTSKITLYEFSNAFRVMTSNNDMMGISKKLLSALPDFMKTRLINKLNEIFKYADQQVNSISFGRSTFLYKDGKNGAHDDVNSFRQIISIPLICNHFHRILALRLSNYMLKNNYIDTTIQKGALSGESHSIFSQVFKIKQIVKHANRFGKEINILFIDLTNAFSNINLEQLYKILHKYGVDANFINYIKSYYENFQYYTTTKDWKTELLNWESSGLIQGCPLSPILFIIALNYILRYLDEKYRLTHGYEVKPGCNILLSAFVDDICLVCRDTEKLAEVYKELVKVLSEIGLTVNKQKCNIMKVNSNQTTFDDIKIVNTCKYLGENISADGSIEFSYNILIKDINRKLYSLDKKDIGNDKKAEIFTKVFLPFIQRKLITLYDLSDDKKEKLVWVINKYVKKWNDKMELCLFSPVNTILENSTDELIKNMDIDYDEFAPGKDFNDMVVKMNDVKFTYDDIGV